MDDIGDEQQFELWKNHATNHMLQAAHALGEAMTYAPEGEEIAPFMNMVEFLIQEADSLSPSRESWPELPNNVIPITHAMRRNT